MFQNSFVILLCFIGVNLAQHEKTFPKWTCIDSTCHKIQDFKNEETFYASQNECKLSCGIAGSIWPHPTGDCSISENRIYFDPSAVRTNIVTKSNDTNKFLSDVNKIFLANIAKECLRNCSLENGPQVFIKLSVNETSLELNWDTNEYYSLRLRATGKTVFVDIKSETVFGARHGLETLSNLITGNVLSNGLVTVGQATISDRPFYKHRGLLIDTSRNFLSVRSIKSTINGMATNKMNVLHWHATDSQSFPLEIPSVPMLSKFGAYSSNEIYTMKDVKGIIKYAKLRGIRVIIEIDGPSHSSIGWEWGPSAGLGNLAVCVNKQPWRKFCIQPPCGLLNPLNPHVYTVLKNVFKDLLEVIPSEEVIHMGGDEVFIPCWNSTEEITDLMIQRGLDLTETSFLEIWSEFHIKNIENLQKLRNKSSAVILWSSHLTDPAVIEKLLPKDQFIIQTWVEKEKPLNEDLLKLGYKLIISTKNAWYLDHGFWGITKFYNWKTVYDNKLPNNNLVLGGEVCMWGEYVDDHSLDQKIWPRSGAAAERLWANPQIKSIQAEERFNRLRERLIARGLHPDAIIPKWCNQNEGDCQ